MLLYTVGNGTNDDNMFKMAAETRMRDIMKSKGFDASKDIVVMKSITAHPIKSVASLPKYINDT